MNKKEVVKEVYKVTKNLYTIGLERVSDGIYKGGKIAIDTITFSLGILGALIAFALVLMSISYGVATVSSRLGIVLGAEITIVIVGITMLGFFLAIINNFD